MGCLAEQTAGWLRQGGGVCIPVKQVGGGMPPLLRHLQDPFEEVKSVWLSALAESSLVNYGHF